MSDEFHNQQIIEHKLFEPILGIVYDTMPKDNLLNSACLELFEFIKRESIKPIIIHLVENYREQLMAITYVNTFQGLVERYEQMQSGYNPVEDTSFSTQGANTPNRGLINGGQRFQGLRENDPEEEAYFNTSDGEEDEDVALPTAATVKSMTNGASPPVRPLVAYPDDDEDAMDMLGASPNKNHNLENQAPLSTITSEADNEPRGRDRTPAPLASSPPERPSEKRRREEDEEDDLDKIAGGGIVTTPAKRRNSVNSNKSADSIANGSPVVRDNGPSLRRKGSLRSKDNALNGHKLGSHGISISLKPNSAATPAKEEGDAKG
jgi:protein phosphatase-4 regulatory subunit 3